MDYNDQMRAEIEAERAENIDAPWWERSPWGGKNEGYWLLREIETFKRDYETTGNPLFVWAAFQVAGDLPKEPAPGQEAAWQWIKDYFSAAGERLMTSITNPPATDANKQIAACFGFDPNPGRGRGSPFSEAGKRIRDRKLALAVGRRLPRERYKETLAIEYVATENGLGISIVREAWATYKKDFGKLANLPK
jgi:hypothetical protein